MSSDLAASSREGDEGIEAASLREKLGPLLEREGGAPNGWAEALARYLSLLRERNHAVNLVSRASVDRVVEGQVVPSFAALRLVGVGAATAVLDIGAGGGFPGIPLKIVRPSIRLDLVESIQKKAAFLVECVVALGLSDTEVHCCRIESPTDELKRRAPFELALARAVGNETLVREAARPLLRRGGALWVFSGEPEAGAPGAGTSIEWTSPGGERITVLRRVLER